jgi:nitrous oxidase accessory protein NosD
MSKSAVLLLVLVLLIASCFALSFPVKAIRTIVVPDDYSTIAFAVGNATDGDTILVRRGTYDGPWNQTLMINKTISLIGEDAENTRLIFHPGWYTEWFFPMWGLSGYEPSMVVDAEDVTVAGFTILTDGWNMRVNGDRARIMGNIITTHVEMKGSHQTFAYNTITSLYHPNGTIKSYAYVDLHGSYNTATANTLANGTIGIYGSYNTILANNGAGALGTGGNAQYSLIYGNSLKDNGGISYGDSPTSGGISIAGTGIIAANNTIINSVTGGVGVIWGGNNIIFGNTILNCPDVALYETDNSRSNLFYANYVANNTWGVKIVSQESNTTLHHNNFLNNTNQFGCKWGYFDNGVEGNYWSNYLIRYPNASEIGNTGIWDTPYVINADHADRYPLMAPFDISSVTLQLPEWANLTLPSPLKTPSFPPEPPEPKPFPMVPVVAAFVASVVLVVVTLVFYFKKRRH